MSVETPSRSVPQSADPGVDRLVLQVLPRAQHPRCCLTCMHGDCTYYEDISCARHTRNDFGPIDPDDPNDWTDPADAMPVGFWNSCRDWEPDANHAQEPTAVPHQCTCTELRTRLQRLIDIASQLGTLVGSYGLYDVCAVQAQVDLERWLIEHHGQMEIDLRSEALTLS